jgi:hypothetical protein
MSEQVDQTNTAQAPHAPLDASALPAAGAASNTAPRLRAEPRRRHSGTLESAPAPSSAADAAPSAFAASSLSPDVVALLVCDDKHAEADEAVSQATAQVMAASFFAA